MTTLAWSVDASVPFDWLWSKNRMWAPRRGTYARRLADHARSRRDLLTFALRAVLRGQRVANNVLLVQIQVEIPDHRGDAINCLDLVCDAVEAATGLDDRWYAISGLTWSVVKVNPQLRVWIGQKDTTDSKVCGRCGEVLPFEAFGLSKAAKTGRASCCRPCLTANAAERRAARRSPS